jgi:hypothetical protein
MGTQYCGGDRTRHERKTDEELLNISTLAGRVMVTQDIRFQKP